MLKLRRKIEHPVLELPTGTVHSEEDWEKILGTELTKIDLDYWFEQPMVHVSRTNIPTQYVATVQEDKNVTNFSKVFETALNEIVAEMNSAFKNCEGE